MPRPKNNSLLSLFKTNDLDQIVCYNEKCDGKVLYKHSANLERHLKLLHPHIFKSYIEKKKILKFPRKLNFEKRLIDLVRECPILWDKFNKDRINEHLMYKAWKEISYKLEVTVRTCRMKWENLVQKFKSELIQFPQSPSGVETVNSKHSNSKSKWKYFSELLFLSGHLDLTQNSLQSEPGVINLDCVKEESSDSFLLYNDILEGSSQFEFGDGSMQNDDLEDSRKINKNGNSRVKINREPSGSQDIEEFIETPSEASEDPLDNMEKLRTPKSREDEMNQQRYTTENSTNNSTEKETKLNNDVRHNLDYLTNLIKSIKEEKVKLVSENDNQNGILNELDPDRMFLLSLWPFLKAIPERRKLCVRHKIQGVLLEEQD